MRHAQLVIHRLHLDGVELPLRHGTLVAVDRPGAASLDWEVVVDGIDAYAGGLERHHAEMLCITGANDDGQLLLGELGGDAVIVRFVGRTVVLRGDGPLTGFDESMLVP